GHIAQNLEYQLLSGFLDPLGGEAFSSITKYWTPAQKNTWILPYSGSILYNRILWISLSLILLFNSYIRFQFSVEKPLLFKHKKKAKTERLIAKEAITKLTLPHVTQQFSMALYLKQFLNSVVVELQSVIKSRSFIVICLMGVLLNFILGSPGNVIYGTKTFPVTALAVKAFYGRFQILLTIVIIIYAGEMIWRERQLKLDGLYDSQPIPDWLPMMAKLTALVGVAALMMLVFMVSMMLLQVIEGYYHFEFLLYLKGLFLVWFPELVFFCVLAILFNVVAANKYIGHMLMGGYIAFQLLMPGVSSMEHYLYRFGFAPPARYSDMNGYGHFVSPSIWFFSYWGWISILLLIIGHLLWVRGAEDRLKIRLKSSIQRFTKPVAAITGFALIGAVLCGSYIYYNTNVLNVYKTRRDILEYGTEHELIYQHIKNMPQPRITDVTCEVDIYPDERRVDVRGAYVFKNKTNGPVDTIYLWINPEMTVNEVRVPGSLLEKEDRIFGYYSYKLKSPMMPSDDLRMSFNISALDSGFTNEGANVRNGIFYNGAFITNKTLFPHIGYMDNFDLSDPNARKKMGLPPKERMAAVDDIDARMTLPFANDSDRVSFDATVSTSSDQIAVAPGLLQKEWMEHGRRYFHYTVKNPIWNFYAFLSAKYLVKREKWNDVDIEIYYDKKHPYNIERMIDACKKSLDYYTANFSPYQHKQLRIVEFPGYANYAQSFPTTIPYSESIGFIARIKEADDIDYVFYVTAHEVAHQWWAHQVAGGAVQGVTLMSETLAQYSALMVMEKEYGKDHMRKFLKYELDQYLRGRARERRNEKPLLLVENQQYLHYNKGSVVMYALKDYVGEENLNRALADYIKTVAYQEPPYTNSPEFLSYIKKATPESLQYIIEDMFETITLYDNKSIDATYTKTQDGKYRVLLKVASKKFRADELGNESEIPINDWMDVGIFSGQPEGKIALGKKELYLKKHRLTQPQTEIEIIVDEEPYRAGIDPYNKLIDKISNDNTIVVKEMS
ncbi:MAG: hypothetical protein KJ882_05505, partial [Proteobacteria bacterium]|nr:hypothetical protein [Pseudomonadota bacterium]